MRLDDYTERDGKRVWLTADEIDRLLDTVDGALHEIAVALAGKCGLRRSEVVSVQRRDVTNAPDGFIRVWGDYAKRDQYREAPIPTDLEAYIEGVTAGENPGTEIVTNPNRGEPYDGHSVYRWVTDAADELHTDTEDRGWQYVDVHDLRRSWGGHLLWNCGVTPHAVMQFGGWSDWDTFEQHYMGEMTPQARDRERDKIDFLGGEPETDSQPFQPATPETKNTYGD